jgi:hypothetical protein
MEINFCQCSDGVYRLELTPGLEEFLKNNNCLDGFDRKSGEEQLKILNGLLSAGPMSIPEGGWRQIVNDILSLPGGKADSCPRYSLDDDPSVWDVVDLPAGAGVDSESLVELQHVHGSNHGVDPVDYVSMGVTISRKDPSKLLINVFQDWSGMCTCFNAIELEKKEGSDVDYTFKEGTFHPGAMGLISETESENYGFLVGYFTGDVPKFPFEWQARRAETRLYRPGKDGSGQACLTDVESGTVYPRDYCQKR